MSLYINATETFVAKYVPITRSMRHIVASRHLQSIETCPHSISHGTSLPKLTSFALFGSLPPELRAQVWAFALLESSMVELEFLPSMNTLSGSESSLPPWGFRKKIPQSLLSTCVESREEAFEWLRPFGYSMETLLSINFAIDSLFLRNLDFGFVQDYWPPAANFFGSGGHLVPLLGIFESVESLVISRKSILGAECEAENIIRHYFPNLCLLIVTVDFHSRDELSLNHPSQLLLHPENDRHISVFGCAVSTCHWDAIYASRIKVNMQRRFARQERIHREYIAPAIKVASARPS
ncbi:hypothetical protein SBOR_3442 [Sclerotinia borealis F-4128]|uniref:2EXR domain-containing protein n=1 Tax=Sclerotinia borealis (strain F-4128) TaxID=1432307 RepID=W9CHD5_SCLBF|nr:hypothetical protein SBOR_3442 [Sclerotinia borealis F-4128]